jgi:hypothetical protein
MPVRRGAGAGAVLAPLLALCLALSLSLTPLGGPAGTGRADAASLGPLVKGAVVALKGTTHLWFADEVGTLHWGGDTRALAGHEIRWDQRREVTLDELSTLPRGAPWLSAGLVQAGEPIYFAKWESNAPAPTLLRVQSIADLELFGIDGTNYNALVLPTATWEQRTGFRAAALTKGELPPATGAGSAGVAGGQGAWEPYASPAGRFAVLLPRGSFEVPLGALASQQLETPLGSIGGRLTGFAAVRQGGSFAYVVASYDLSDTQALALQSSSASETDGFYRAAREGFFATIYEQVLAERPLSLGSYSGRETTARGSGDDGLATLRLYLVRQRLYVLMGIQMDVPMDVQPGSAGTNVVPPEVTGFLDSFRLLA